MASGTTAAAQKIIRHTRAPRFGLTRHLVGTLPGGAVCAALHASKMFFAGSFSLRFPLAKIIRGFTSHRLCGRLRVLPHRNDLQKDSRLIAAGSCIYPPTHSPIVLQNSLSQTALTK